MTNAAQTQEAKVAKAPSKSKLATAIFNEELAKRAAGEFASNKAFRAVVLRRMESELGVSTASAATMYNTAKTAAEAVNPAIALGRDPRVEKAAKAAGGKRGRKSTKVEVTNDAGATTEATTEATA